MAGSFSPNVATVTRNLNDSNLTDLQSREILRNWLAPPHLSTNRNTARAAQSSGTGSWFIQGGAFIEWKTRGTVLWIRGIRTLLSRSSFCVC
jgi:hypothetical protein